MKKLIYKPQLFFLLLAIFILIVGLFFKENAIDIAIYSTLTDLSVWSICLFSMLFFILIAINYTSLSITLKTPKRGLTIAHIVLQILALIPLLYFIFSSGESRSYEQVSQMNIILILSFFIFIIATTIHLINFIISLIAKKD